MWIVAHGTNSPSGQIQLDQLFRKLRHRATVEHSLGIFHHHDDGIGAGQRASQAQQQFLFGRVEAEPFDTESTVIFDVTNLGGRLQRLVPGRDLPFGMAVAGAANGTLTLAASLSEGRETANAAAKDLGFTPSRKSVANAEDEAQKGSPY